MTEPNVIALAGSLTSIRHLRHSFSDPAEMVHNTTAGPCEKVRNDTPSRWFIPAEFADTVELNAPNARSRLA
jgi:hypothetical protein